MPKYKVHIARFYEVEVETNTIKKAKEEAVKKLFQNPEIFHVRDKFTSKRDRDFDVVEQQAQEARNKIIGDKAKKESMESKKLVDDTIKKMESDSNVVYRSHVGREPGEIAKMKEASIKTSDGIKKVDIKEVDQTSN